MSLAVKKIPEDAASSGILIPFLFRWLIIAALADWLIGRTVTRSAIFMPKSPGMIVVYEAVTFIGQFAFTLSSLLALIAIGWIAWRHFHKRSEIVLPVALAALLVLSLLFLFVPPESWLAMTYQLFILIAIASIGKKVLNAPRREKIAWLFAALALIGATLYQLSHAVYAVLRVSTAPPFATFLFNGGELFFVLAPIALGYESILRHKLPAALAALAFGLIHFFAPAMTGIIAIWSTGLTLYLPSIFYALAIGCVCALVIDARTRGDAALPVLPVLLILAGGYAPQLSSQLFLNLIGLWLLASNATLKH
jgi:hypothetical protein